MIVTTNCKQKYTVRKLTPIECARLQGFPDWWCENLENENPSEEDMEFWRRVFKTYYTINGKKTIKTDKQIVKWLSSDNGDSARYKMWGNGVALPNVIFVLSGIAALNFLEEESNEKQYCEWIKYDSWTICPKYHDANNPYWRIPENTDKLKYCPYCGKKITIVKEQENEESRKIHRRNYNNGSKRNVLWIHAR